MNARALLTPALGTVWGVSYAEGYLQGLVTPATRELWEAWHFYGTQVFMGEAQVSERTVRRYGTPIERMKRLHRLAAVRHIVTTGTVHDSDLSPAHAGHVANVYSYARPHPRWWLAREAVALASPSAQLESVKRVGFDPERQVVVDREVALEADADGPAGTVTPVEVGDRRLRLRVECPGPRVLVVADAWYPGWSVTVDSEPAELLRANYAFRAVMVPAGTHDVEFSFFPATWGTALPMFGVGLLVVIALTVWPTRRPPREGLEPPPGVG